MKKITLTTLILFFATFIFAQNCNIVFFSEGGERFYLTMNGVQYNKSPETNVKVQALNEAPYKAKIVFEDNRMATMEKTFYPINNNETTYILKRKKKDNSLIIRLLSQTPIADTQKEEVQVVEIRSNQNDNISNTTTTTTHTTTTSTNNDGINNSDGSFSMNVNINGSGMNVDIKDDMGGNMDMDINDNSSYSETTTTTTTTTSGTVNAAPTRVVSNGRCNYPTSGTDFADGKNSIESKTFADSKMTIAKQITKNSCLTAVQIRDYTKLFSFESDKLTYAKYAYNYCYDKGNYYKVNDAFEFESTIEELAEHTGN